MTSTPFGAKLLAMTQTLSLTLDCDLAARLGVEAAGLGMSQEQYALAVLTQALGANAADDVEMENFLRDRQAIPAQEVTAWLRAGGPDGGCAFPKARTVA
ncbi:MAG: hypothetical protein ACOYJ6_07155 [Caulobacterales bacterium]|jgi:plasmid stability protein